MLSIIDLCDRQLYVESDRWQCGSGYGQPVRLGLVLEAVDLDDDVGVEYSFVIDASLIPQPECMDEDILEEARLEAGSSNGSDERAELIRYVYECYGGVPVNIDAVQPPKNSCGASSFVANSSIKPMIAGNEDEMETRHFQDLQEAMSFARDFYADGKKMKTIHQIAS